MIEALLEPLHHPRGWPYRMAICGALQPQLGLLAFEATHLVGIDRRGDPFGTLFESGHQLALDFADVTDVSRSDAPHPAHLEAAMSFVDDLPPEATLVIRCPRGISRSTALALGLLARAVAPPRAARLLHSLCPFACPNLLLVRLWDDLLGLDGELVEMSGRFPTFVWRHVDGCGTPALSAEPSRMELGQSSFAEPRSPIPPFQGGRVGASRPGWGDVEAG